MPPAEYENTEIKTDVDDSVFLTKGKVLKVKGYLEVSNLSLIHISKSTTFVMPRNPRKRGKGKNDKKKRGISKEQICIETAIDRKGNILMGAVCNGRICLLYTSFNPILLNILSITALCISSP